jgi:DNA-binding NarL/FixJ family response regulator
MDHLRDVPVIIYTTSKIEEDVQETLRMGAKIFVQKPNDFRNICKTISSILEGTYEGKKEIAFH